MGDVDGAVEFSGGPKGVTMNSVFLAPVAITKDNLNEVIDAGWITKEKVCQGVSAGSTAVCN
jgi:D-xylose transport system substrate-binding protein